MMQTKKDNQLHAAALLILSSAIFLNGCTTQMREDAVMQNPELRAKIDAKYGAIKKAVIVYCARDVPEGDIVSAKDLEEKFVDVYKIPENALPSARNAAGRKAKYGLASGQVLLVTDLTDGPAKSNVIRVSLNDKEFAALQKQAKSAGKDPEEFATSWFKSELGK